MASYFFLDTYLKGLEDEDCAIPDLLLAPASQSRSAIETVSRAVQTNLTFLPFSPPASFPLSPPITPQARLPTTSSGMASMLPSAPLLATAPNKAATSRVCAPLTELELNQLAVSFVPVHDRSDVGTFLLRLMALLAMYTIYF